MKPSTKSPQMESVLTELFGDRRINIERNICNNCGKQVSIFKDKISEKEFAITGFCQQCQDRIFAYDP